jgi:3-oxoacyl-[acyl-carrier-protein] synthase III
VLLVGAEVHTGFMPWTKWDHLFGRGGEPPTADERAIATRFRDRTVLFGDAGGAVVLRASDGENGLLGFELHSDGANYEDLYVPGVGFAHRPFVDGQQVADWSHVPEMNGRAVFKLAVSRMPQVVRELCAKHHMAVGDIGLLIAHQANLRISEGVQKALGLADDRVYNNIQKYGNTTAATIPIALDECRRSGRIQPGDLVCLVGLGSGFHWGAALLRA